MLVYIRLLTRLLNHWFAAPVDALMRFFHIEPTYPRHPIGNTLTEELVVFFIIVIFFVIVRLSLSVEKPRKVQHLAEMIHEFVDDQSLQVTGHSESPFLPLLTALLLFILLCNLFGLLPGLETPTANAAVPLGLAICVFVYYNFNGLLAQGPIGYLKHFIGPADQMPLVAGILLAILMFPIEIISHFARILSLTVRLFANMLASDLITIIFFSMVPLALPIVGLGLHAFVAVIQAYIFVLLTMIYLGEATAHQEHH